MTKRTNEKDLYEILEKQRGVFCQIAFIYVFTVIIGLGLVNFLMAILGPVVLVVDIIFLITTTVVFMLLADYLHIPVAGIDKRIDTTLKHIISQVMPEEEN